MIIIYVFFRWHEIGIYDIVANIDYILRVTKKKKLYFIGHSSGGSSYLALAADRPEYNYKIKVAALLAPAAIFGKTFPGLRQLNDFLLPAMVIFFSITVLPFDSVYSLFHN